jgi:hypothetical protein
MGRDGWVGFDVLSPGDVKARAAERRVEIQQADARNVVNFPESSGQNVFEILQEFGLRQIGNVAGHSGNRNADFGDLSAIGQFAVGHTVVTADEQRTREPVIFGIRAGPEGHGVAAILKSAWALAGIRQAEGSQIGQIIGLDEHCGVGWGR